MRPAAPRRDKNPGGSAARKEAPHDSSRCRNQHRGRRFRRLHGFETNSRRQRQFPRRRPDAAADVGWRSADGLGRRHQRHPRKHRPGSRIRLLGGCLPAARAGAVPVPDGRVLRQADEPDGADVVLRLLPIAVWQAGRGRGIPDAHRRVLPSGRRQPGGGRLSLQLLPRYSVLAGRGHHRDPRGGLHRNGWPGSDDRSRAGRNHQLGDADRARDR